MHQSTGRVITEATVVGENDTESRCGASQIGADAPIVVRTDFETKPSRIRGRVRKYIDRAVQGVGPVQRIARSANNFNTAGQLGRQFEQLIDIAEAGRPDRHAILQHQERTAGTGAGQNG